MSNANYEPLGSNRKVFGGLPASSQPQPLQNTNFVGKFFGSFQNLPPNLDAMGKPIQRQAVTGVCSKCGFAGHLPFQCRNNLQFEVDGIIRKPLKPDSSPEFETPLQKEGKHNCHTIFMYFPDRKEREREAKRMKKQLKKLEKKRKKEAKKRKRSSSTSSSDSDRHHSKKHKKERKSKKSKKRRRRSSSSSSSD
jgi:hypothetical protein